MANYCESPYIPRSLSRIVISSKFLHNLNRDSLIVVDCMNHKEKTQKIRLKFKTFDLNQYLESNWTKKQNVPNILLAQNKCSKQDFQTISSSHSRFANFHHFRLTNRCSLEWLRSDGHLDPLRTFIENGNHFIEEKHFYNDEYEWKINLLTGDPGIGKTAFMESIYKSYLPNYWPVLLNRTDMIDLYQRKETFEKYILEKKCPKNDIDRKICQILIANNQIVCIWDGINEIISENIKYIVELILQIAGNNTTQWVTSRTHLKNYMEEELKVFAKHLKVLTTTELRSYAKNSLDEKYRNFEKLSSSDIFAIPLHLVMSIEVLKQTDNVEITDLYQHFIDEKFHIYFAEKADYPAKTRAMRDINKAYKSSTLTHLQQAAAYLLVPELKLNPKDFLHRIKEEGDSLGFIVSVDEDNKPGFAHVGFAEYLVARYLVDNHQLSSLKDVLLEPRLANIRFLINLLLSKN